MAKRRKPKPSFDLPPSGGASDTNWVYRSESPPAALPAAEPRLQLSPASTSAPDRQLPAAATSPSAQRRSRRQSFLDSFLDVVGLPLQVLVVAGIAALTSRRPD